MSGEMESSEGYKKIKEEYLQKIPEKIQAVEQLIQALHKDPSEKMLSDLRGIVHKIAGTAATFGFEKVTQLCKSWDLKLTKFLEPSTGKPDIKDLISELDRFLIELKNAFQ